MNSRKRDLTGKTTKFIFTDVIDTPYPYCVIPKKHFNDLNETIEKSVELTAHNEKRLRERPRSLLSVTTWDGRELFDLRSLK